MKTPRATILVLSFLSFGTASAQPPVGPDPRPKVIALDDLNRVIGGSTLVTLKFTDARPEAVAASLAKQAGFHLDAYETTSTLKKLPAISVDLDGVPVLVALKSLAAKQGLNFTLTRSGEYEKNPSGLTLRMQSAADPVLRMEGPTLVRGPFLIIATSVQRTRTNSLSVLAKDRPATTRDDYALEFVFLGDPKLLKHGLLGVPTLFGIDGWTIRSVDGDTPWRSRASEKGSSPLEWRFSAHRRIPPLDPPKVPTFAANATRMLVTTKTATWEVADILSVKDVSKEVTLAEGKRLYTVHEIKEIENTDVSKRGRMYTVKLGVSGVGVSKGKWSGWPEPSAPYLFKDFRLVDAEGREYARYGDLEFKAPNLSARFWSGAGQGDGATAKGPPVRAIWTLPAEFRSIEIPIEFANLPLP